MACVLLAFGALRAGDAFRITRVELVADRLELSWEGEPALDYFEVQRWDGRTPEDWEPILLTAHRAVSLEQEGLRGLLRIAAIEPPGPPRPISDVRRGEILDDVADKIAALPGNDAEADAVAAAAILRSYPEIESAGISSGAAVTSRYRDGRPLLIINDRPPADPSEFENGVDAAFFNGGDVAGLADDVEGGRDARDVGGRFPRDVRGTTGLPVSRRAVLFQARGMGIASPMLGVLIPAFDNAGFQVQGGEASLANFLAVSGLGNDIGVLYVDTHGGILRKPVHTGELETGNIRIDHVPVFAIATSTVVNALTEAVYRDTLFADGEIGYAQLGPSVVKGLKRAKSETYYFISPEFVRKRWRFGRNSLVFFDTCHSASDGASAFRALCFAAGAALYAGWTDSVHDAWAFKRTTPPFFELLLGGSHIYHTVPPQRPFHIEDVLEYLDARDLRVDRTPKFPGARFTCFGGSAANGSFRILNPSIEYSYVSEFNELVTVNGNFDPEAPATVRVEGGATTEIPATVETRSRLTFPLSAEGSPSAGNVTVIQHGRESNTVPLSEWTVDATLVKHFSPTIETPSATMEFQLRFRADVHEYRRMPFTEPLPFAAGSRIARGTIGRVVSASGTYHYPGENQGTLDWSLDAPVDVPFANLGGNLTVGADRSVTIDASLRAGNVMTVTQRSASGQVVQVSQREPGTGVFPPGESTLDPATYRINAGTGSASGDGGTFEWKNAEPRFPPTGDFAR